MRSHLPAVAGELGTTDRTLRRAVNEGLIRASRPSPRKLELAPAEHVYLRESWKLLAALRAALRTEPGVAGAFLFGSRARGDHREESDVDLVVALRHAADRFGIKERLEAAVGLPVQLVSLDHARDAPLLLEQVTRDGRVLVDREHIWPELMRQRASIRRAAARERRRIRREFDDAFPPA